MPKYGTEYIIAYKQLLLLCDVLPLHSYIHSGYSRGSYHMHVVKGSGFACIAS